MTRQPYDYKKLIQSFVKDEISTEDFKKTFLHKFKNEEGFLSNDLFDKLDWLFAEIDLSTNNQEPLHDNIFIDEKLLKGTAEKFLLEIEKLK